MMQKLLQGILEKVLPRWSPLMFKATMFTVVAAAFVIPLALAATPFIEFFNGMAAQPKGKAQMTYGRTHDEGIAGHPGPGGGHHAPRLGALPAGPPHRADRRGQGKRLPKSTRTLLAEMEMETAREAGRLLANPVPLTEEALLRGKNRYDIFCIVCHGPKGPGRRAGHRDQPGHRCSPLPHAAVAAHRAGAGI